jgi:2-amino-4-hydroxy-6-hydroxymethyldihydropteridine diphosphokinase
MKALVLLLAAAALAQQPSARVLVSYHSDTGNTEKLAQAVQKGAASVAGVARIETELPPEELKHRVLRGIEQTLGRQRTADKFAPRPIDLDLLLYGNVSRNDAELCLPDPQIADRPFLLLGLRELSADQWLSGLQDSVKPGPVSRSQDGMEPLSEYTRALRAILGLPT